jgi:hypothetical protein
VIDIRVDIELSLSTSRDRYTGRYTVELSLSTIGIDIQVDIIELSLSTSSDRYTGRYRALSIHQQR